MPILDHDNSNLGMEIKESQVMHIPFDEHFSLKNTKDGTIIEFRDRNRKSHTARISKWRLRAVWGLDVDYLGACPVIRAIIVLRKKLGELAFAKYDAAAKVLGELSDKQESSPEWETANQALGEALRDILFRSEISCMALPMVILANMGKRFEITSETWPHRHPPEILIHLGSKGFNGKSRLGILAFDFTSSRDFWIVDQFDETENHVAPPMSDYSNDLQQIQKIVGTLALKMDAIEKNQFELVQENAELQDLASNGFFRFATRVEADDFRAFAAIMLTGNRNRASQSLGIPQRSFYDLVDTWLSRGPDYRRMYRMADWRKKTGRKIKVRLDNSLLGTEIHGQSENPETVHAVLEAMRDKTVPEDRSNFLKDILEAMRNQNAQNWPSVKAEVIELLEEEHPQ
jgi:hypothetical protein